MQAGILVRFYALPLVIVHGSQLLEFVSKPATRPIESWFVTSMQNPGVESKRRFRNSAFESGRRLLSVQTLPGGLFRCSKGLSDLLVRGQSAYKDLLSKFVVIMIEVEVFENGVGPGHLYVIISVHYLDKFIDDIPDIDKSNLRKGFQCVHQFYIVDKYVTQEVPKEDSVHSARLFFKWRKPAVGEIYAALK